MCRTALQDRLISLCFQRGGVAGSWLERSKEHRGTRLAYVADLVGEPRPLLRACLGAVGPDARALVAVPAPEHRSTYASLGFFPTRTSLRLMGKALAGSLDADRRAWRFTLGDTDFF